MSKVGKMLTDLLKALIPLVHPLGFVWLLLGLWLIWKILIRGDRRGMLVPVVVWLIFTLATCTPVSSLLMAQLENQVPHQRVADLPMVDAVVCLGGIAEPSKKEATGFHLRFAADRLSTALVLLRERKAPALVLGGGAFELSDEATFSEADHLREGVAKMGVNTEGIISLGLCADTHDEALKVAKLMQERGWKRIILVTSAAHMPRSKAVFAKQGIDVVAAPCNYISLMNRIGEWDWLWLPNTDELHIFGAWLHEIIGLQMYRLRGWID